MKRHIVTLGMILGASLVGTQLNAQTLSDDAEKKARELLKSAIEQRESRPAKTPVPVVPAPAQTVPAPEMSATELRGTTQPMSFAEVEQAFLSGKITARQFQKYLKDKKLETGAAVSSPQVEDQALAMLRQTTTRTNVNAPLIRSGSSAPSPAGAVAPTAPSANPSPSEIIQPEAPAEQTTLSEVEKKMDELLRLKAAREQAALQATALRRTNAAAAAPKTKRERMDELLKQYIGGKIAEPEYNAKRKQLLAEPETKN